MLRATALPPLIKLARQVLLLSLWRMPMRARAGPVAFDFNSDPSASGLLTLYGNAIWIPTGRAGAGTAPYCDEVDQSVGPDIIGVDVRLDGVLALQVPRPTLNGACTDPTSIQTGPTDGTGTPDGLCWAHVKVALDTNGFLNVYWKNTLIISNYPTSYSLSPGRLVFAGRTGGAWEYHHVDNIAITTIPAPVQ